MEKYSGIKLSLIKLSFPQPQEEEEGWYVPSQPPRGRPPRGRPPNDKFYFETRGPRPTGGPSTDLTHWERESLKPSDPGHSSGSDLWPGEKFYDPSLEPSGPPTERGEPFDYKGFNPDDYDWGAGEFWLSVRQDLELAAELLADDDPDKARLQERLDEMDDPLGPYWFNKEDLTLAIETFEGEREKAEESGDEEGIAYWEKAIDRAEELIGRAPSTRPPSRPRPPEDQYEPPMPN